jgi:TfoX/Sxy family transcriptional regulator of competence genes
MEWKKATPEMIEAFKSIAPGGPEAEERKMFGCPCAFVHGNMFMGLHGEGFIARLPGAERAALIAAGGSPFEPMPGRPMREYVVLPQGMYADPALLSEWVRKAYAFASALLPKAPKANKAAKR